MINRIFHIVIIIVLVQKTNAQNNIAFIKQNNLIGAINASGLLFDSLGNTGLFSQRNQILFPLINSAGIWLSAKDSTGKLHVAAHNVLGNNHEFWAGPLDIQNGQSANPALWNKVYPMSQSEIGYHKANYKNANYSPSLNILNWPGSSNAPYANVLAPFVDVKNNNKIYEPILGDYPYINSDALIYSISNDNYAAHTYSNSSPLGVEVHTSLYAFNSNDSFLQNALLARYVVHNRSGKNYNNFRLSNVINFKIGNLSNEFLGTDIKNKNLFAINDTSEATFQNKLVSIGCMMINRPLNSTMYFKNEISPINGKPVNDTDFYNLMQGKWKNGKKLTYGSDGIDGNGLAKYIFPYTSDNQNGNLMWNEQSAGNTSGQRIGLLNTDSNKLQNGKFLVYDFVYYFVEKNSYDIKQIHTFCSNITQALTAKNILNINQNLTQNASKINMYPNPVAKGGKITIQRDLEIACTIKIFDLQGKQIFKDYLHNNENSINLPPHLADGMYFLNIETLNTTLTKKITIY